MDPIIVIRGAGDIATGIALRLFRSGFQFVMIELAQPLAVRRSVSFAEAIYSGFTCVENIKAMRIEFSDDIPVALQNNVIPIIVDEELGILKTNLSQFPVLIDARMEKKPADRYYFKTIPLVIGIGPGFTAGYDCHTVVESSRGHFLGHVYRRGNARTDTGQPAGDPARILRAPMDGIIVTKAEIGDLLETGQVIATVANHEILAPFSGLLRGLIHSGVKVYIGMKIGDLDHNTDKDLIHFASDKAMAIGGSVLEVIMSDSNLMPIQRKTT